jgi:hypothetical protein
MKKIRAIWTTVAAATLFAASARGDGLPSQVNPDVYQPVASKSSMLNTVTNGTKKLARTTVNGTKTVLGYPVKLVSGAIKKIKS